MKRQFKHRGYIIDSQHEIYTTIVGGRCVSGTMLGVKQCIDWWCDTQIFRRPEQFERQGFRDAQKSGSESYKGIQIRNDEKKPNLWYMLFRGQLLKGSLSKLKQYIDQHL